MDPPLCQLRDQVLYLKHNLNAAAIGSLRGTSDNIQSKYPALVRADEPLHGRSGSFHPDAAISSVPAYATGIFRMIRQRSSRKRLSGLAIPCWGQRNERQLCWAPQGDSEVEVAKRCVVVSMSGSQMSQQQLTLF